MWKLIVKVFLCYWIAAGIVIVVSDIIPHGHLRRQESIRALESALQFDARSILTAYQSGGCVAALPLMASDTDRIYLASPDGTILCGANPSFDFRPLIAKARIGKGPVAIDRRSSLILAFATTAASGRQYILLLDDQMHPLFWYWPGTTTFIISVVVTLFFAILIAVPIRRLSSTAQDIANGRLDTRVSTGNFPRLLARPFQSDVIQKLIADFNNMADRLQSLVESERTFLRDVSHELRTPLARLSIALELARLAGDPSMGVPLDRIEEEAARVDDLIEQLLTLSQMEVLPEIKPPKAVSLSEIIAEMMPDIEYEAHARKCRIIASTSHDCFVLADRFLLQRAFENVARNAIHYTPEDGTIEIVVEKKECNGNWQAVLRISDSGPGVPIEELQKILLPFHRVDEARQRSKGGFGVGLAIADRVVRLHDGQIVASNKPSGGLIVEMSFPLASAA